MPNGKSPPWVTFQQLQLKERWLREAPGKPPTGFQQEVTQWQTGYEENLARSKTTQTLLQELQDRYSRSLDTTELETSIRGTRFPFLPGIPVARAAFAGAQAQARKELKARIESTIDELERYDFYTSLYAHAPTVIASGKVTNPSELVSYLRFPPNMPSSEIEQVIDIVERMIETITTGMAEPEAPEEELPEMALETEPPGLPPLKAPTMISGTPININLATISEIRKALTTPLMPPAVLSEEEWAEFLVESGEISKTADLETIAKIQADAALIVDQWQERENMLTAYRQGIAEMPDYELVDFLKEMIMMPGLGLLEVAGVYFEHVSQPLAGLVYGAFVPDIQVAYERYVAKGEGGWEALSHAWQEWDSPGEGASEWILKYMLMEGLVDPITYVGWGIATRVTKPLGPIGRWVGATERGIAATMEMPFDLIKSLIRKAPKTLGQRATLAQHKAMQYVEVYMAGVTGGKALFQTSMKEWDDAAKAAIKYTLKYPQTDNVVTRAGHELLKHNPLTEKDLTGWARRLESTLTEGQITKQTVESVNRLFDDFFSTITSTKKLITPRETGDELVRALYGSLSEDTSIIASKLLTGHAAKIVSGAMAFSRSKTALAATRTLAKRNYNMLVSAEESTLALARRDMGAVSGLLTDIPNTVQKAWTTGIDKWIVRPFAEAYLTFALYGPMNIVEDVIRSVLGGVAPGRKGPAAFARKWAGTSYDQNLMRDAVSETYGYLRTTGEGELNNWILQLGGLAKGFGDNVYNFLVRRPGQVGIDMRRNFVDRRATQILKEIGGDQFARLANIGPPKLTGVTNRRIARDVQQTATGLKIQGQPEALRAAVDDFTRAKVIRREVDNILMEHPELPRPVRDYIMRSYDDDTLLRTGGESIDQAMREADNLLVDDFIHTAEYAHRGFEQLTEQLVQLEVRNPQEMAQLIQSLNMMSSVYGATPKQILGRAVERSRGLPFAERRASIDMALDNITVFREKAGVAMDKLVEKIKLAYRKAPEQLATGPEYITKADSLFNLQTAKRLRASELGEEINAWRHEWFAGGKPKDLVSADWWDDFYMNINQRWHDFNVDMADFDGQIKNAIDDLNIAGGLPARQRPAIVVTDRPLAPNDIAQLLGARGDDISRGLLDVMTAQNDRDMFISYVMAQVRSTDSGFTKESVGAAYDQVMNSLHVDPATASWISGKRLELGAVKDDLNNLYNSKMLPDDEVASIGKYFNDTADAVDDLMFTKPPMVARLTSDTILDLDELTSAFKEINEALTLWIQREDRVSLNRLVKLVREDARYSSKMLSILKSQYGDSMVVYRGGLAREGVVSVTPDKSVASRFGKVEEFSIRTSDVLAVGPTLEQELLVRASSLKPPARPTKPILREEFTGYNDLRQEAMDESHKWYYKEFTDYSNANAFDACMKAIYPFWTYESQRWFWLPRSFVRHPGTFTAFERWQDNSEYGYIHIPGTSVDINPFRGTIYGTLATRLSKRDFPEYYDSLGAAGNLIEFSDWLSRYGFYPGAHIGAPLAMFGGVEMQFGETMPAFIKTPLDAMIALFPESESVKWISGRLFGDRFRDYLTLLIVNRLGGDGSLLFAKQQEGKALTPEEEQLWADARREVGWYSAGFEQFSLFRMRTDEQYKMYQEAAKVIEEMTGYTPDQQKWLRQHQYRIWDMVGGMSPSEQQVLEQLEYYRWVGQVRPLLPGRQQDILNKIEVAWDSVEQYGEQVQMEKLQLQNDLLNNVVGPDDYNSKLLDLYDKQREFIDNKVKEYPLMDLKNRADYYKEFNVPQPVLHPMRELLNLYYSIELQEITDPETGEKMMDWDNFWAQRQAIEDSVPDEYKQEWEDFLSKNSTRMEEVRREVYHNYFRTYNLVWNEIVSTYPEEEQALIEEYLFLERTGQKLDRQEEIKQTVSTKTDNQLISSFRSEISDARRALRYANPHLDAWLFYWGRVGAFANEAASRPVYEEIAKQTGRRID